MLLSDLNGKDSQKAADDLKKANLSDLFSYRQAYFVGAKAQHQKDIEWLEQNSDIAFLISIPNGKSKSNKYVCIPIEYWKEFKEL